MIITRLAEINQVHKMNDYIWWKSLCKRVKILEKIYWFNFDKSPSITPVFNFFFQNAIAFSLRLDFCTNVTLNKNQWEEKKTIFEIQLKRKKNNAEL